MANIRSELKFREKSIKAKERAHAVEYSVGLQCIPKVWLFYIPATNLVEFNKYVFNNNIM